MNTFHVDISYSSPWNVQVPEPSFETRAASLANMVATEHFKIALVTFDPEAMVQHVYSWPDGSLAYAVGSTHTVEELREFFKGVLGIPTTWEQREALEGTILRKIEIRESGDEPLVFEYLNVLTQMFFYNGDRGFINFTYFLNRLMWKYEHVDEKLAQRAYQKAVNAYFPDTWAFSYVVVQRGGDIQSVPVFWDPKHITLSAIKERLEDEGTIDESTGGAS